jgi:hypothetical protein
MGKKMLTVWKRERLLAVGVSYRMRDGRNKEAKKQKNITQDT